MRRSGGHARACGGIPRARAGDAVEPGAADARGDRARDGGRPGSRRQFSEVLDAQEEITAAANPLSFGNTCAPRWSLLDFSTLLECTPGRAAGAGQPLARSGRTGAQDPGLADVMRPPDVSALRGAVAGGAAVFVNVSDLGSHALLVTPDGIDAVELPGVTGAEDRRGDREFWPAIHMLDLGIFDRASRAELKETMKRTRRWLWDAIPARCSIVSSCPSRLTTRPGHASGGARREFCRCSRCTPPAMMNQAIASSIGSFRHTPPP